MISVHTETNEMGTPRFRGWVLFDGECEFCRTWARRMERVLSGRGFLFIPLQTPWVRAFFHLREDVLLGEMRVLLRNGTAFGGADAIVELGRYVWWGWPLFALAQIPGVRHLLRAAYRWIAARRQCLSGACSVRRGPNAQVFPSKERAAK
jgi:predicted DCC family thiol-disulfide oxidoreductase YuxK